MLHKMSFTYFCLGKNDADIVMFIHREDKGRDESERTNIAEILIEKHRNGPTGRIELYFDDKTTSFLGVDKNNTGSGYNLREAGLDNF